MMDTESLRQLFPREGDVPLEYRPPSQVHLERARLAASGAPIVRVPSAQPISVAVTITEVNNIERSRSTRITISWKDGQRGHFGGQRRLAGSPVTVAAWYLGCVGEDAVRFG